MISWPIMVMPPPPKPWTVRPAIIIVVEFAPPATPLPIMNRTTAEIIGHRRPATVANWAQKGIKEVLIFR